jgi:ATP-dependent DNA ligase
VRLITRGGYNWTDRYPWTVEAARKIRQGRFVLDGEAVKCHGRVFFEDSSKRRGRRFTAP